MQSNLLGYHNTHDGGWRIADPKVESRFKVEGREKYVFLRRRLKESALDKTASVG